MITPKIRKPRVSSKPYKIKRDGFIFKPSGKASITALANQRLSMFMEDDYLSFYYGDIQDGLYPLIITNEKGVFACRTLRNMLNDVQELELVRTENNTLKSNFKLTTDESQSN